eukprot:TRINITY_DN38756_c0_g1_i1.p1 TRINITY_DN38756_c0_g1~~TRINITY_DN38756_c0_g1_i1.p1  ORF type:complete len:722 (-),score=162.43 TRINITY_DN38756_c0_g1_i1:319-2343(-)
MALDDTEESSLPVAIGCRTEAGACWASPQPAVFKSVCLRWKLVGQSQTLQDGSVEKSAVGPSPYRPQHGPIHRSLCTIKLQEGVDDLGFADGCSESLADPVSRVLQFRLGDTYGHKKEERDVTTSQWRPPIETQRVKISQWLTEAALLLEVGQTAEFEAVEAATIVGHGEDDVEAPGPISRCRVTLLDACRTDDLLGDDGIILRVLDDAGGAGEKPADLARVWASWRVWFSRNGEFVLSFNTDEAALGKERAMTTGKDFLIDEGQIMVALELAIKAMPCGSRAVVYISEQWGSGPLTPEGNPRLNGAAIWADVTLHRVVNEMQPGGHDTVDAAVVHALEKKRQGNASLSLGSAADLTRAVRRYEAGSRVLEAVLKEPSRGKDGANTAHKTFGPLADEEQRPAVYDALKALLLNCAQAELKRSRWKEALVLCNDVLKRDVGNVKALYRRGLAHAELDDFASAAEDLRRAAAANPSDPGLRKELARVEGLLRDHRAAEKKQYGGFIEKELKREEERLSREEAKRKEKEDQDAKKAAEDTAKQEAAMAKMRRDGEAAKAAQSARDAAETAAEVAKEEKVVAEKAAAEKAKAGVPMAQGPLLQDGVVKLGDASDQLLGDFVPSAMKIGSDDQKLLENMENVSAPMLPPNLQTRTVEEAPPVEYEMPSFLKKRTKKASK